MDMKPIAVNGSEVTLILKTKVHLTQDCDGWDAVTSALENKGEMYKACIIGASSLDKLKELKQAKPESLNAMPTVYILEISEE